MKAFNILRHIELSGINNSKYHTFTYTSQDSAVDFVKRYFGGNFIAGSLKREKYYIAFWESYQPNSGVPDALVTDREGTKIYIYEVE